MDNDWAFDGTGMVHLTGIFALIRACLARALGCRAFGARMLVTLSVLGGALALAGCYADCRPGR
jgi:hypothetical protein